MPCSSWHAFCRSTVPGDVGFEVFQTLTLMMAWGWSSGPQDKEWSRFKSVVGVILVQCCDALGMPYPDPVSQSFVVVWTLTLTWKPMNSQIWGESQTFQREYSTTSALLLPHLSDLDHPWCWWHQTQILLLIFFSAGVRGLLECFCLYRGGIVPAALGVVIE